MSSVAERFRTERLPDTNPELCCYDETFGQTSRDSEVLKQEHRVNFIAEDNEGI